VLAALGEPTLIRIPATTASAAPRARFVSCLLHGNEPSGFRAMVDVLRRGERFPFDLWVLIGNVRAALADGLFAHRHLDGQDDFNRVWGVASPSSELQRSAAAIVDVLRTADLEAAIDLHNNTGRNPYYAIVTEQTVAGRHLAALCADTVLLWGQSMHTLMEVLAPRCPAVSVECGAAHLSSGTAYAASVVHRFLTAEGFDTAAGVNGHAAAARMVEIGYRVTVRPEVDFSFGAPANGDTPQLAVVPGLDTYNFATLPAHHPIGHVEPGAPMPLRATDGTGADVTDQLFRITPAGDVVVTHAVTPIMMTTSVQQTRRDCLFYTALPVR